MVSRPILSLPSRASTMLLGTVLAALQRQRGREHLQGRARFIQVGDRAIAQLRRRRAGCGRSGCRRASWPGPAPRRSSRRAPRRRRPCARLSLTASLSASNVRDWMRVSIVRRRSRPSRGSRTWSSPPMIWPVPSRITRRLPTWPARVDWNDSSRPSWPTWRDIGEADQMRHHLALRDSRACTRRPGRFP